MQKWRCKINQRVWLYNGILLGNKRNKALVHATIWMNLGNGKNRGQAGKDI